jgi:hypothetical protein
MDEENKRIDISDLPRAEEELTVEEAKNVQGGVTKIGPGTLTLSSPSSSNAVGGSVADGTYTKTGDGSV